MPSSQHARNSWQPDHYQNTQYQSNDTYLQQPRRSSAPALDIPNFSVFPPLKNHPPNVPPTDEEKEATLEAARAAVLTSNDVETQLTWAHDALAYVEVCQQNEQRVSTTQPPRPSTPRIEHVLREDALKVVKFLAEQSHPKAEYLRGTWLEFGKFGHRIDKREAYFCYTRASDKGYARADYRIGMQFESSNEPAKAIKYFQRGVDAGDPASCCRLAMMSLLGQHGQPQDYQRGLNLVAMAAQNADEDAPQGAYVYGMLLARDLTEVSIPERFLAIDLKAAKMNIEKAAYLGFAKAQSKMGSAYELCELGCPFEPALSLHYSNLAARRGDSNAEMAISKWFLIGYEGVFERNEEVAFTYAQRAAVAGLPTAQFAMGYYYEVGIYVPVNYKIAKEWYERASASGNKDAPTRIDSISRSKTLSRRDHENSSLAKIRQQHRSRQSPIDEHPLPDMPPTPALDMPDPSRLSLSPRPPNRPPSTAPYPTNDPGPRPGLPGQQPFPEPRPKSAFGINPNLRPGPTATLPADQPGPYQRPTYQPPARPYPNADGVGTGAYHGPHRMSSMPTPGSAPPGSTSPYFGAQGTRLQSGGAPRPGSTSPYLTPQGGAPSTPGPPPLPMKADIGFSAPLDTTGADRRRRGNSPAEPNRNKPPAPGPGPQPGAGGNRPTHSPAPPARPAPVNVKPAKIVPSNPPKEAPAARPVPAKPTTVAPSTRLPGKGPKTFEEMGVPQGKSESDCVSVDVLVGAQLVTDAFSGYYVIPRCCVVWSSMSASEGFCRTPVSQS